MIPLPNGAVADVVGTGGWSHGEPLAGSTRR
jgi:hypothetical protein